MISVRVLYLSSNVQHLPQNLGVEGTIDSPIVTYDSHKLTCDLQKLRLNGSEPRRNASGWIKVDGAGDEHLNKGPGPGV